MYLLFKAKSILKNLKRYQLIKCFLVLMNREWYYIKNKNSNSSHVVLGVIAIQKSPARDRCTVPHIGRIIQTFSHPVSGRTWQAVYPVIKKPDLQTEASNFLVLENTNVQFFTVVFLRTRKYKLVRSVKMYILQL